MMGEAQGYTEEKSSAALKTERREGQTSTPLLHHSGGRRGWVGGGAQQRLWEGATLGLSLEGAADAY